MANDIRIPVTIGGVTFKNPFYVASGPTTKTVRQLQRIEETGWAAASIKLSIDPAPYINRKPRYGIFEDRNALAFTTEKRLTFEQGLKLVSDAKKVLTDLKLMANITYAGDDGPAGWVNMAQKFEEAGADIIELNMCCPNMSYNLELTSGGSQHASKQTGASMGQNANIAAEIARAVKQAISIPLFVKLTPEGGHIAQVAKSLYEAGADAVGGTGNRMGLPPINLEHPEKAFYHLQDEISMSCHCGAWLKPLAQRDTYEIRKVCGKEPPIMAAGGITNWKDAVEMVLCGGNLIGVCAETLISGYDIVRPMIQGMHDYMQQHGYASLDDFRSLLVDEVKTATEVTLYGGYAHIKEPNLSGPCKVACPHNVPVQAYVQKIAKGDFAGAYETITSKEPFQNLCSFVCTHPCEDACVRGSVDRPVAIRDLKRFVFDYAKQHGLRPAFACEPDNGHRIAVIGGGPAGLACAAWLRRAGYAVTLFEKEKVLGGGMRCAVPRYRLDHSVLDEEIEQITALGVEVRTGVAYGADITAESLKADGFERVFVATGAAEAAPACGESVSSFMRRAASDVAPALSGTVVVEARSYAGVDAARTAVRLGASKVYLVFDKLSGAKSFTEELVREAREEGIGVIEKTVVVSRDAHTLTLRGEAGIEYPLSCDTLLVETKRDGTYRADPQTLATDDPFVFAGGEAVREGNIIAAIAAGKRAAASIDKAVRGAEASLDYDPRPVPVKAEDVLKRSGYLKKDKAAPDLNALSGVQRAENFATFRRTLTEEEAVREAGRCLNCGCGEGCQLCKTICTDFAPFIEGVDRLCIDKSECVACGMCFNRCPNHNIEMVSTHETV